MDASAIPADIPLAPPPAGETSDFHAKDLQPLLIGTHAAFLALMLVVLAARLYVRGILIKCLWWEDYLAIGAALVTIADSVIICTLFDVGYGRHAWNVRLRSVLGGDAPKRLSGIALPYPLAVLLIKLSVSMLYWRIFNVTGKKFRIATVVILIFCVIFYLGNFAYAVAIYSICSNIANIATNPNCGVGTQIITWVGGILNVVTDVYLLILPIPPLAQLKMGKAKKFGLWIVFSAGGLASAASVARLVTTVTLQGGKDYLYLAAVENVPTTIELCLGVVAASIPTLGKMNESPTFRMFVSAVQSYASSLSLVRRTSLSDADSIPLSVHNPTKSSDQQRRHQVVDVSGTGTDIGRS